jgi:fibronectin type 3 domain-containing protein/TolB-like protein
MFKRLINYVVAVTFVMVGTACADDVNFRPKLGCIPFLATSLQAMAFTENISSSLLNSIDRSGFFEIVERKKIEQFLELEGLRLDNLNDDSIVRIGSKAGLDYVVHGSVSMTESGAVLDVNLLHVRSRKLVMKESFSMSESDFSRRLLAVADSILDRVRNAGSPSVTALAAVSPVVVPLPKNVAASGTTNSIRLEWQCDALKQVVGFNIYRATSRDGQYSQHATTTEPVFMDENLKLNEVFFYRVVAVGQTGVSSEMTVPVRGATSIAPPAPIFMNAEPDIKGVKLSWRPRPGAGGDPRTTPAGYRLYRRLGDSGAFALVARLPVEAVTHADSGLSDGVKYVYTITAHNSEGAESEFSAKLSTVPLPPPNPVRASSGRIRQVALSWNQYPGETAEGYVVYRSDAKDGRYAAISRLDGLTRTGHVDSGLTDNTTYWYRLSVFKKGGTETDPSEPVSAVTRDVPPAPQNLTAGSGEPRRIKLRWQLAGTPEDEIKSVVIYRTMDEKGGAMDKVDEISGRNEFMDETPPLQDKATYYYRVCSRNSGGAVSARSESVSATTKAPPLAPAGLSAASGEVKKITLRWEKNRETDIKQYQVFRKRSDESDFKELRELGDNQFEDAGLADGGEVAYKVRAIDRDGLISRFSDSVTARTKPLPARVAGFKSVDAANRVVTWQPNREKDVGSYTIYKKGFLGVAQKLATVKETRWKLDETKGKVEIYVTAVDDSGLESEPSDLVVFE